MMSALTLYDSPYEDERIAIDVLHFDYSTDYQQEK